jgi:8-oxo-dGTP diphosphatase
MALRDQNGLTEQEFLARYRQKDYPRPSLTVDIVVLLRGADGLRALLIRRGGHPFLGCWALPGGFVEPSETAEAAAARELMEETHLSGLPLYPLGLFSAPGRDPRAWVVSQAYAALLPEGAPPPRPGDDARDARFFGVSFQSDGCRAALSLRDGDALLTAEAQVESHATPFGPLHSCTVTSQSGLAFDHAAILLTALLRLA